MLSHFFIFVSHFVIFVSHFTIVLSHFMISSIILWFSSVILSICSVILRILFNHSQYFATVLGHLIKCTVILWFPQSFFDFRQTFSEFCYSAQSFCDFSVILWGTGAEEAGAPTAEALGGRGRGTRSGSAGSVRWHGVGQVGGVGAREVGRLDAWGRVWERGSIGVRQGSVGPWV
jgi:hypothetical protein